MTPWIIALAAVAFVVLVVVVVRRRRAPDTVQSFQRQIDALGPAARRPVVDQVHRLEAEQRPEGRVRRRPVAPPADGPATDASPDDASGPDASGGDASAADVSPDAEAGPSPTTSEPNEEDERGA